MRALISLPLLAASLLAAVPTGPDIGRPMPAFEAQDQDGKTHTLHSLLGPQGAVILFYRSADWWPFCKAQLVELERNRDEFRKLGLGIAAISYDSVAILHDFAERKGIHYPLLSDPESKIIRSLGILNEAVPKDNPFFGIPHPGSYVVNAKGVITAKYFEDDYKQRYTSADILVRQFGVIPPGAGEVAEGKQLTATATVSNSIVDAGQRVSLVLNIELKPKMHVYAPSVKGYIPIEWTLKDSDAWVPHEVKFPEAKNLYLKAIDETVPVYAGKFRLTREITLGPDARLKPALNASGQLTVEGTLRYQACDDRVCYIPQTLPVKWTFQYEAFDRQRAPAAIQHK